MVAADAYRVPRRQVLLAPGEDVRNQAQRAFGREDVGAAGNVLLEDVVLRCATHFREIRALLLGHGHVEGQQHCAGSVDGHGSRDLFQRDVLHQKFHVSE